MKFKGDIIITDPCYIFPKKDNDKAWIDYCDTEIVPKELKTYIWESTIYGDWSCTTFSEDNPIGEFCADAGLVGVFLLDEVLAFNPEFDYHTTKPWTTTLIKDFDGNIDYEVRNDEAIIVGKGNIDFITSQTGV